MAAKQSKYITIPTSWAPARKVSGGQKGRQIFAMQNVLSDALFLEKTSILFTQTSTRPFSADEPQYLAQAGPFQASDHEIRMESTAQ